VIEGLGGYFTFSLIVILKTLAPFTPQCKCGCLSYSRSATK